ncbi:MAG TPA: Lrp/AsnC family transcriptional regulator [Caldilineaceae bacterium]|nr:Lrp/AsnC family transcriptional regulator [Caldilineaceae bacterium]
MDKVDRAIIAALKEDGRTPYSRIAEQLGVSPGMIRQRVQRLNEQGILQVVAVTNPLKIGYHTMALIGVKAEGQRLQQIARQIAAFDEVIYLTICSAAYNLLVEVLCLDNSHLLSFLTEKLYSVEGVRDTETFIYLDIVKEIYAWDSPAVSEDGRAPIAPRPRERTAGETTGKTGFPPKFETEDGK